MRGGASAPFFFPSPGCIFFFGVCSASPALIEREREHRFQGNQHTAKRNNGNSPEQLILLPFIP